MDKLNKTKNQELENTVGGNGVSNLLKVVIKCNNCGMIRNTFEGTEFSKASDYLDEIIRRGPKYRICPKCRVGGWVLENIVE